MRESFRSILVFWILSGIGLLFWFWSSRETGIVKALEATETIRRQASRELEAMEQAATPGSQLLLILSRFSSEATRIIYEEGPEHCIGTLEKLYRERLEGRLPPHDIVLLAHDVFLEKSTTVLGRSAGLGFFPGAGPDFLNARCAGIPPVSLEKLASISTDLGMALDFPVSKISWRAIRPSELNSFSGAVGERTLFTSRLFPDPTLPALHPGSIGVLVDTSHLAGDFACRMVLENWKHPDRGLGFVPKNPGPALFSSFFDVRKGVREILSQKAQTPAGVPFQMQIHDTILFSISLPESPYFAVLGFDLPSHSEESPASPESSILAFGIWILLGFGFLMANLACDGRMRIPVWVTLAGTLFFVVSVPLLALRGAGNRFLGESKRLAETEVREDLLKKLEMVDKEYSLDQTRHWFALRHRIQRPDTGQNFFEDEMGRAPGGALASLVVDINSDPSLAPPTCRLAMAAGPGGFSEYWAVNQAKKESNSDELELFRFMTSGPRKRLRMKETGNRAVPTKESQRDELEFEIWKDVFFQLGNAEAALGFLFEPEVPRATVILQDRVFFSGHIVKFEGRERYNLVLNWSANDQERRFLRRRFGEMVPSSGRGSIFAFDRFNPVPTSFPPGVQDYRDLTDLAEKSSQTLVALSALEKAGTETFLLETLPGKAISRYLMCGRVSLGEVEALRQAGENRLWWYLLGGLLTTFGLAVIVTGYFLRPLRRILRDADRIRNGTYDLKLLDADRPDEFGTLAKSIESLAKGLHEREILRKFVSSSVQRVVSEGGKAVALEEGRSRDVTVIFSHIRGFNQWQESAPPEQVFRALEDHLGILEEAVGKTRGEINLVIGEKILAVFDDQERGALDSSVQAALETARHVASAKLSDPGLEIVMGINRGSVVAGVLGAPTVRLEYTVIGDPVNLASRLATLGEISDSSRIVVSGDIAREAGPGWKSERLPIKRVKGKTHEVEAWLLQPPI